MTLRVPFEQFSDAVRLHLQTRDVYAQGDRVRTIISAADSDRKMIVIATVHKCCRKCTKSLEIQVSSPIFR